MNILKLSSTRTLISSLLRSHCPTCNKYQNYVNRRRVYMLTQDNDHGFRRPLFLWNWSGSKGELVTGDEVVYLVSNISATRKRFYRGTGIIQNENKWEVTLDHRRLKTPNGRVLVVQSEPLARAVASEWDSQTEVISQPTMHLTALCNTALDNPGKITSHDIASYLLEYFPTDTLLFHSDEEEELKILQLQKWIPVLEWFQKRYNVSQEIAQGLEPPTVSPETRAVLARHFLSYDFAALNAFTFGVEALKSSILMLACVDKFLEPKEAVLLARLEEEYQLARWGRVPWAHELNQADLTARVAAALLVIQCSSESYSAQAKVAASDQTSQ